MSLSTLADPLYERLLRSFPADQAYTSADWDTDTVPSPVRHYLDHLLHHHGRQETDRLRRARTDWVDYDHPETEQAARTFFDAIETHAQVPSDQWAETLRTATHRTTDYLVRPVPTLRSFAFEASSNPVPMPQIRWRMRFFGPYAYLRDAVQAFAKKRDREALTPDAFEQVLRRVDERMTADFDADRWIRLLDPLFNVARRATDQRQVPLSLLRTFFEEKNAARIADRLTAYELGGDSDAVPPGSLRPLIDEALTEDQSDQREVPESPLEDDAHAPMGPSHAETTDASSDESAGEAAPMWKQFAQDRPPPRTEAGDQNDDGSQPLWTQFQKRKPTSDSDVDSSSSPASETQSPSSSSLSDSTSISSDPTDDLSALEREVLGSATPKRTEYIQKLFQGDEDAYRQTLERLRATGSWSTASQIIASEVFREYQVNIYSDAAVHFTNAVEAGFQE
jgi:hypothetical protein